MNIDNLVKELLDGKTSDEIAAEMAQALNAAIVQAKEVELKAEEERIAAEQKAANEEAILEEKKCAIANMIAAFCDYLEVAEVEPELIKKLKEVDEEELEVIVEEFDEMLESATAIFKLANVLKDSSKEAKISCDDAYINKDLLKGLFGF